ncbi:RagB/SusD family nutrient uptake outer membrane protein [Dyadobacter sp. LJ53]|uniref:RagB/SusD family nutrient uptake outer membrane protein n=1 Tax=Dyadobacter chenwenxiniae TaxID=2906456 RepID=UPI001F20F3AD|nr:RagB/SusD family nutrient uptake outer membrane protein [Dyadobacter chenwenxiniae]MCF0052116.1 RagB/SusD family nutrient uptake outer membrane protein [Dyadobacter chenwenxiniae]
MKKYSNTFKLLLLSGVIQLAIISCVDLDEAPKSFISTDQFFKTQADAIAAVNAIYFRLNATGQTPYHILFSTGMDMMSDDVQPGPGATNADVRSQSVLSHSSTGLRVREIWQQHYDAINRANIAIDKIPAVEMDATLRNRLVMEAKFLRALYYFNLVRLYGDVPLVVHETTSLSPEALYVERTPAEQVYQQIIQDLTDAHGLPNDTFGASGPKYTAADAGRATGGAARSLLAKVYLTRYDYVNAIAKSAEVIDGTFGYGLFADYAQVFLPANKNGIEHIFSAQFEANADSHGNNQAMRSAPTGIPGLNGNFAEQPMPGIYELYSVKDKRRDVSFITSIISPANGQTYQLTVKDPATGQIKPNPHFNKWWDPAQAGNLGQSAANVPILRFSDVLLIHAEAVNEQQGPTAAAYASYNKVRRRAGLDNLTPGLTQAQFRDSLRLDRRLEFVFEYSRWFDLIRYKPLTGPDAYLIKSLKAAGKNNVQPKHYLYPIPQQEIDNNPKLQGKQNPGW